jgi:hypothetical protein
MELELDVVLRVLFCFLLRINQEERGPGEPARAGPMWSPSWRFLPPALPGISRGRLLGGCQVPGFFLFFFFGGG